MKIRLAIDSGEKRAFATAVGSLADAAEDRSGAHQAYNVGSGIVSTVGDLARALSSSRNGPAPIVTGQYRLGDVRHITASSQKIHDELSWQATVSLAEGVSGLTFG